MNELLSDQNKALNELQFQIVAELCNYDIACMFLKFMTSGLDKNAKGFWIWDVPKNKELYSPKFRKSLGFEGEIDFPSIPASWQSSIFPEDYEKALSNLNKTIETKGAHPYEQIVRYNKKHGGVEKVLCFGTVVKWEVKGGETLPQIMVGVHMNHVGLYESNLLNKNMGMSSPLKNKR